MDAPAHPALSTLHDVCDAVFTLDGPALVGIVADDRGYTLRDGPGFDWPEDLVGFTAPSAWDGVAAVVSGQAHDLDRGDTASARVSFVLTRAGAYAGSITTADGATRLAGTGVDEPPIGHLADVCHRILGRSAAPEPSSPNDAMAALWLDDVLSAADLLGDGFDLDDWPGLLSLHPLGGRASPATWAELHGALVACGMGWGDFDADQLAWMDAPTWARFVLAATPPLRVLVEEIRHRVSISTMALVHTVVDRGADSVRGDRGGGG